MTPNPFDAKAASWDTPERTAQAQAWADTLRGISQPGRTARVAEFGCGTGLMALVIAPHVGSILALDNSTEMLAVLAAKCRTQGVSNVTPRLFDIEQAHLDVAELDLFFSCTALHHVRSPERYAELARRIVKPGGSAVVIDLDREDGSFHRHPAQVFHNGFERSALATLFQTAGFGRVDCRTLDTVKKIGRDGALQEYPIFILHAHS